MLLVPEEQLECTVALIDTGNRGFLTGANGAGMGLYITRSLVELHGGRIWFESDLGKGSAFHVTFPIADGSP